MLPLVDDCMKLTFLACAAATVRKQLKDLGLDLVASLTLLESDFGRCVRETVAWWSWVVEDLEKGEESTLCPITSASNPQSNTSTHGPETLPSSSSSSSSQFEIPSHRKSTAPTSSPNSQALKRAYCWWEQAKNGWQAYYDIVRFHMFVASHHPIHAAVDRQSSQQLSRSHGLLLQSLGRDDHSLEIS